MYVAMAYESKVMDDICPCCVMIRGKLMDLLVISKLLLWLHTHVVQVT